MASVAENCSKFEVRAVVRFLQAEGVHESKINCRLVSVYGQNVFHQKEVPVWRKLHNEELHRLYSSPSIIRMRPRHS
jgi:hypothetical protein